MDSESGRRGMIGCVSCILVGGILLLGGGTARSATVTLTAEVLATDNIFFTPWGHEYIKEFGDPPALSVEANDSPLYFGIGAGTQARAVADSSGAFNFRDFDFVDVTATGDVIDFNITRTDSDGNVVGEGSPPGDPIFRKLKVYSLIGIWSSEPTTIVPIGAIGPESEPAFNIGSLAHLVLPDAPDLYLFLANNDGVFWDNFESYDVRLIAGNTAVPLPGALGLMLLALGALKVTRSRLAQSSRDAVARRATGSRDHFRPGRYSASSPVARR